MNTSKTNIFIPISILLIIFSILTISIVNTKYQKNIELHTLTNNVNMSIITSKLIHELQAERGLSSGYIASKGKIFGEKLKIQREQTKKQIVDFRKILNDKLLNSAQNIKELLSQIEKIENDIENLNISSDKVIEYYSNLNAVLIQSVFNAAEQATSIQIRKKIISYFNFLKLKEYAGIQRAVGTVILLKNQTNLNLKLQYHEAVIKYAMYREDFTKTSNSKIMSYYKSNLNNTLDQEIEDYEILKNFYDTQTVQDIENRFEEDALKYFLPGCKFKHIYALGEGQFAFLKENTDPSSQQEQENDLKVFQHNVKGSIIKLGEYEYDIRITVSYATQKEDLFKDAMLGLEHALKNKKDFIYADGLTKSELIHAAQNIRTIKMIQKAISKKTITSFFQPIINNKTGQIEKYESLVRLIDNDEIVSPAAFLDIAKKGKYYQQITDIVLDNSFQQLTQCDKEISINLSAVDIEEEITREKIMHLLEEYKEHTHRIIFELLEDEDIKDFTTIKTFICDVKAYNVQIAIDDFGAGHSNFERILDYQPDIIKIDRCLISNIDTNQKSHTIVETIYTFASKLGMKTVAEFVSSKQIHETVSNIGIDYSQGYYFGKPEPLLKQNNSYTNENK